MRQGQQNRRGRGRNRKSQNPLTRSFESNGPDIKIRGTPSHIAEKYISMARDALASGDPVLAENYLQHAEHYNRIIMTYREQQVAHGDGMNGSGGNGRARQPEQADADEANVSENEEVPPGQEPQPTIASEAETAEAPAERGQRRANGARGNGRRRRGDGGANGERNAEASGEGDEAPPARRASRRQETFAEGDDQPEFLKRPVRRRGKAATEDTATGDAAEAPSADEVAE